MENSISEEEVRILLSDRQMPCFFCGLLAEFTNGLTGKFEELEGNCALMFMPSPCLYFGEETTYLKSCQRLENAASRNMVKNILLPNFTVILNSEEIPAREYFSGKIPK